MRILFYVHPEVMPLGPQLNLGWFQILRALADRLQSCADKHEVTLVAPSRFLAGAHVTGAYRLAVIDEIKLHRQLRGRYRHFAVPSACESASQGSLYPDHPLVQTMISALGPDVCSREQDLVISFGIYPRFLQLIWPNAVVMGTEVSGFSRSPFPFSLYFDHLGMYRDSAIGRFGEHLLDDAPSSQMIDLVDQLREQVEHYYLNSSWASRLGLRRRFERTVLLPLQVSAYYSFDQQTAYRTQFEYLFDFLASIPSDIGVVVTEYVQWGQIIRKSGPAENAAFLRRQFSNLLFLPQTRKIWSPSPYLLPLVDGVWTITSNLAYQAALLGKRIGTAEGTFLEPIAHNTCIDEFCSELGTPLSDRKRLLAWYLDRYAVPDSLLRDPEWLSDYLQRRVESIKQCPDGCGGFVPLAEPERLLSAWLPGKISHQVHGFEAEEQHWHRRLAITQLSQADEQLRLPSRPESEPPCGYYVLLNDTSAIECNRHLGCNVVTQHIKLQMANMGLRLLGSANTGAECARLLQHPDVTGVRLVILNGEGSVHDDSPRIRELMQFAAALKARGARAVLVNTVWHNNSSLLGDCLSTFDLVALRESRSLREIRPYRSDAQVVPDFSFAGFDEFFSSTGTNSTESTPTVPLIVVDGVATEVTETLRAFAEFHGYPFYLMGPLHIHSCVADPSGPYVAGNDVFPQLLTSPYQIKAGQGCVTGRFHAAVAALIQSTPFLALGSNTPKVEGLLEDIGIESTAYLSREWLSLGYHEMQDVITARLSQWNDAAAQHASAYTLRAVHAIAQLWDVVADIVKQPNPCQLLSPVNSNATSQHIDRPASQFSVLDNYQTHERQQINQQLSESQRHLESEKELNAALTAQNGCLMADLDRLRRESELANASLQNENTDLTAQNGRLTTELDRLRRESEMARATLQHELATPLWKKAERAIRVRRRAAVQTLVRQVTRICGQ